jgi:hypothetical protein
MEIVMMNMPDGSVEGHRAGCADLKRHAHKFAEPDQAKDVWDYPDRAAARADYNADFDEETDGWYDIRWMPCAAGLPE